MPRHWVDEPTGVALVARFRSGDMVAAREFVGCVHRFDPHRTVMVLVEPGVTDDEVEELRLFEHTLVVDQLPSHPYVNVSLTDRLSRPLPSHVNHTTLLRDYFNHDSTDCTCFLAMRYEPVVKTARLIKPAHSALTKKSWCMLIATYVAQNISFVRTPLLEVFLPSFLASIQSSLDRFAFSIYLGTQLDPVWDSQGSDFLAHILQVVGSNVSVALRRYPLHARLRNIVWKYNDLARAAYNDGCDYIYQFSDDAQILDSGWPEALAEYLEERQGFGTVGMTDTQNAHTMTLGASGRLHLEIQGWFWPPTFKNWYADDYIQHVYGPNYSKRFSNYRFKNTQARGQRYTECMAREALQIQLRESRRIAAEYWMHANRSIALYLQGL